MILKNWIILGAAVTAILAYTIGIPPSFSTEYTKTAQYTSSANSCGNTEDAGSPPTSPYESLVDSTGSGPQDQGTYCANTDSQVQGEGNTVGHYSSQR